MAKRRATGEGNIRKGELTALLWDGLNAEETMGNFMAQVM